MKNFLSLLLPLAGLGLFFKPATGAAKTGTGKGSFLAKPRGFRQKNPGNLRPGGGEWLGLVGENAGYLVFASMEYGVRAAYINLRTYFKNGFNTVEKIIERWAPSEDDNHTENYIQYVAERVGVDRDQKLVFDVNLAKRILAAIFYFENGQNVPTSVIDAGVSLA